MELQENIVEIKREFGEFDKVRFTFRYLKVNNVERTIIEKELSDLALKINEIDNDSFVITFPLTADINSQRIKNLNEKIKLTDLKYGIFVAFTTNYDHSGFGLPKEIRDFYQVVGGVFDCSIIMI